MSPIRAGNPASRNGPPALVARLGGAALYRAEAHACVVLAFTGAMHPCSSNIFAVQSGIQPARVASASCSRHATGAATYQ
jgi:Fe-S cluster biogenesis protein NfuA